MTAELKNKQFLEWKEAIKKSPLTDEVCIALIQCSLEQNCEVPSLSLLHACVNKPPCKGMGLPYGSGLETENPEEQLEMLNGRYWCKGRNLKMGTDSYKKASQQVLKIYKQTEKKRLWRLKNVPKTLVKDLEQKVKELEKQEEDDIEKRLERLKKLDEENELEKRFEKLLEKEDKFIEELKDEVKYLSDEDKIGTLRQASQALQNKKVQVQCGSEVLEITREKTRNIKNNIETDMKERKKTDTVEEKKETVQIDTETNQVLQLLSKQMQKMSEQIADMKTQINSIDKTQEKVYGLATDIKAEMELQNYVETWYNSKLGLVKKILMAPLKALNIIVWKPAKFAFWHFFGKWFYLLWGMLMLLLVIVCVLTTFSALKIYYPGIYEQLFVATTSLKNIAISTGSFIAQNLSPWFKENIDLVWNGITYGAQEGLAFLYNWIIEFFITIFKTVMGKTVAGISSLTSWFY